MTNNKRVAITNLTKCKSGKELLLFSGKVVEMPVNDWFQPKLSGWLVEAAKDVESVMDEGGDGPNWMRQCENVDLLRVWPMVRKLPEAAKRGIRNV